MVLNSSMMKMMLKNVFKGYEFSINPFLANVPILYPLKTPENQRLYIFLWFNYT